MQFSARALSVSGAPLKYKLHISREDAWRGSILDTVMPIAEVELAVPSDCPDILHAEAELQLLNGQTVVVGCGWSASAGFAIGINDGTIRKTTVHSDSPVSMDIVLKDGNLYILKICESSST
jgi:hypothetical protein